MSTEPTEASATGRGRIAGAAARLGAGYKANREVLEPLARLAVDVLAVAALFSRRSRPATSRRPTGE